MDFGKAALSFANLSVRFWAHVLKKPFVDPDEIGRKRFDENYADDKLAPHTAEQTARLPLYETCINCGLCDAACASAGLQPSAFSLQRSAAGARPPRPSLIPIMASRAQSLFHNYSELASFYLACGECRKCEEACPNAIPIKELAKLVVDRACRNP